MVKHHGERSKLLIVITSKSSLRIRFPVDKATLDHISPSIYDKYEPQNCEDTNSKEPEYEWKLDKDLE